MSPVAPTPPDQSSPSPLPSRPRRRWWRLSVRGLMLLVLLVGGTIGWKIGQVNRMRRALAVLHRPVVVSAERARASPLHTPVGPDQPEGSRVEIEFADCYGDGQYLATRWPGWLPDRVRAFVGDDHFRRVEWVKFRRRPTPEDWAALRALGSVRELEFRGVAFGAGDLDGLPTCPGLRILDLYETGIADPALAPVGRLHDLRELDLGSTRITAAGLAPVANLARLEVLAVGERAGTDAGLAHLRGLTNLRSLDADSFENHVSDAGLAHLQGLTRLENLGVSADGVTDAGMAILAGLPRLETLRIIPARPGSIAPLRLSPAGIASLGRLTHLTGLEIESPALDDAWLAAIGRLTGLCDLRVAGDGITEAGLIPLGQLTGLLDLEVAKIAITDPGLAPLARLTKLQRLLIIGQPSSPITDAGLAHLAPLIALDSLSLPAGINNERVAAFLASHPKLERIHNNDTDEAPLSAHESGPTSETTFPPGPIP